VAGLEDARRRAALAFSHLPLRWSVTAGLVWSAFDRWLAARVSAEEAAALALPGGRDPQAQGPRLTSDPDVRSRAVSVWRQSSLQTARLCEGLGIAYFHFLQPNQYVPGGKPMGEAERRIAFREDSPMRLPIERGYAELRQAGASLAAEGVALKRPERGVPRRPRADVRRRLLPPRRVRQSAARGGDRARDGGRARARVYSLSATGSTRTGVPNSTAVPLATS
jgi:hypothetical protein